MRTLYKLILLFVLVFSNVYSFANYKADTLRVDQSMVNTSFLKEGTSRYLVYFIMGKDATRSRPQFWTRSISFENHNGREAIVIKQEVEDRDSLIHTAKSVCDKKTFAPLYHQNWWKPTASFSEFDFVNKSAIFNGTPLSDEDTARTRKAIWQSFVTAVPQFILNWHIDLEVFPVLPYKEGAVFVIPFFDPGASPLRKEIYTVTGSGEMKGYNNQKIDCWKLSHESRSSKEVFWISKQTQEVLLLENEIGKDRWRYKIKLGFSI